MTARDNLALCAMQVLLKEDCKQYVPFWQRIRRFFGVGYYSKTCINYGNIATRAYAIADAMIETSEKE